MLTGDVRIAPGRKEAIHTSQYSRVAKFRPAPRTLKTLHVLTPAQAADRLLIEPKRAGFSRSRSSKCFTSLLLTSSLRVSATTGGGSSSPPSFKPRLRQSELLD